MNEGTPSVSEYNKPMAVVLKGPTAELYHFFCRFETKGFPEPNCTHPNNTYQHYFQRPYIEFCYNLKINISNKGGNTFTPIMKLRLSMGQIWRSTQFSIYFSGYILGPIFFKLPKCPQHSQKCIYYLEYRLHITKPIVIRLANSKEIHWTSRIPNFTKIVRA
jgi:hypothetical protein